MNAHRHRPRIVTTGPFFAPVGSARENPAAHGNITLTQTCGCGAMRMVNVNGEAREVGQWWTGS